MKKLKLTKVIASTLIAVSALVLNPIGASAEWRQSSTGWWYAESNSWATGWRTIDGKWYYFNSDGYMAKNTTVGGYQLGSDGAWVVPTPTASTTTTNTNVNTTSTTIAKDIGFDKMELSSSSSADVRKYYNKYCQVSQDINELSIGGEDYLNTYKSGNITGYTNNSQYVDYVFDLNCNYSRFTALAGVDDLVYASFTPKMSKASGDSLKITIIADGSVLDTKTLYYGEKAEEIDVNNLAGYSKLILRVQRTLGKTGSVLTLHPAVYYDILGGKFYHK